MEWSGARRDQATYDETKKLWADRLVALVHQFYPGTVGKVVFADISTPLTLETYLRANKVPHGPRARLPHPGARRSCARRTRIRISPSVRLLTGWQGAGVGLDATPARFVDPDELAELDMKHPRVPALWRCGQDYLMYGQILSAASGIVCALRMLGPLAAARYVCRSVRLLLLCGTYAEEEAKKSA